LKLVSDITPIIGAFVFHRRFKSGAYLKEKIVKLVRLKRERDRAACYLMIMNEEVEKYDMLNGSSPDFDYTQE
jgi:hypothetical protein